MEESSYSQNSDKLRRYYETHDIELRNEILLDNTELVWYIVKRYTSATATKDDMFNAGMVGLTIAINRFEPDRGNQLSTYAVPYIQNEIRALIDNPDYIDDHEGLTPIDTYSSNPFQEKLDKLYGSVLEPDERTVLDIILRTGDEPAWSINDIAKKLGMPSQTIGNLYASGVKKLNEPWVRWYIENLKKSL